ncbi:protein of unassigned function [Methylobacterium oryzae CBMB20]|uniref:Protein of unassigned function n=1 Tax=Methylobacterium oryzae CBMB20 TaxID=693986 RepID=A0A089QEK9_9HYPH|nr:protein of unassigned function [Methylobacterium oryzae CBMB20]
MRSCARMPDGAGDTLRELPATERGGRQGSDLDFARDGARRRASRDLRR